MAEEFPLAFSYDGLSVTLTVRTDWNIDQALRIMTQSKQNARQHQWSEIHFKLCNYVRHADAGVEKKIVC
jgi:hypothetical protein